MIKTLTIVLLLSCLSFAQMYERLNVQIIRANDRTLLFNYKGDLSNDTLQFVVKATRSITSPRLVQKISTNESQLKVNYYAGVSLIEVYLQAEDTEDRDTTRHWYDITRVNNGDTSTLFLGWFDIWSNVATRFDGTNLASDGSRFYVAGTFIDSTVADSTLFRYDETTHTIVPITKEDVYNYLGLPDTLEIKIDGKLDVTDTTQFRTFSNLKYQAYGTYLIPSDTTGNYALYYQANTQVDTSSLDNRINKNVTSIDSIANEYSESSFQSIGSKLMNWKLDFIQSNYRNQNNAKIGFIGDSYVAPYSYMLQLRSQEMYGNGGIGYLTMNPGVYASTGIYDLAETGWTTGVAEDTLSIHGYYATNDDITTNAIKITRTLFNVLKIHYKQVSGGGSFRYKVNYSGAWVDTVSTDGSTASTIHYKKWASTTYATTDTLYINAISGTVRIYGVSLTYEPYANAKNKAIEYHRLNRGGTAITQWTAMSNTALATLLDSLDISVMVVCFLEAMDGSYYTNMDALVSKLKSAKSDMDILLVSPNQVASANQSEGHRDTLQLIANAQGVAYFDFFNRFGSYTEAAGLGLIGDGVHLTSGIGGYYPTMELFNILFPKTIYYGNLYASTEFTLGTESQGFRLGYNSSNYYQLNSYYAGSSTGSLTFIPSNGRTTLSTNESIYMMIDANNNSTSELFALRSNGSTTNLFAITDAATPTMTFSGTTTLGSTGTAFQFIKSTSATLDFPEIASQSYHDTTITLGGLTNGDPVFLGVASNAITDGIVYQAFVTSSTQITVRCFNYTSGAINPASATFRVAVIKF